MDPPWSLSHEGHPQVITMSNACHEGHLCYNLPAKETLQALWPCRPEAFPICLELHTIWAPLSEIRLALYCRYRQTTLGYTLSELTQEAWVFYKWAQSAIDEVVNQHLFHSIFMHEPVA